MRSLIVAMSTCLISGFAAAQIPPPKPSAPPPATAAQPKPPAKRPAGQRAPASAVAEFQALIDRTFTARSARRADILAGNYSPEGGPFFDLSPARHDTWTAYRAGLDEQFGRFASLSLTPGRDLKASRSGTMAWTAVTVRGTGTRRDGSEVTFDARHTAVWSRQAGEWRMVHEHFSVPSPSSAGVSETATHTPEDEEAVKGIFRAYEEAWNAGAADRLAALWDEQGDAAALASGAITTGREAVQKLWTQSFARRAQQKTPTTLAVRLTAVRFLTPTTALADGTFDYRAGTAAGAAERYTSVIIKTPDGWRIASTRVAPSK